MIEWTDRARANWRELGLKPGGLAINAAAIDTRVKATVASTMYDMTRVTANGYNDAEDSPAKRREKREAMNAQRIVDFRHGTAERAGGVGLVRSALAFELSACFEYAPGAPELPSHVRWQGRRFALTMDLAPLLLAAPPP